MSFVSLYQIFSCLIGHRLADRIPIGVFPRKFTLKLSLKYSYWNFLFNVAIGVFLEYSYWSFLSNDPVEALSLIFLLKTSRPTRYNPTPRRLHCTISHCWGYMIRDGVPTNVPLSDFKSALKDYVSVKF